MKDEFMLTVIIPTMNRSDFIIRLLNYYAEVGFKYWIFIGDSSNAFHVKKTKIAINSLEQKLNIRYYQDPGLDGTKFLEQMLNSVFTPYAVYIGDDDFLIPNSIDQFIMFLENHKDYNSVNGIGCTFSLDPDGPYGNFLYNYYYRLPLIEAETASKRILDYLENYSVNMFSIHRTEDYQDMLRNVKDLTDKSFVGEMLPCCISVIQGKAKHLENFYLMRQEHGTRYELPEKCKWINSPNWGASYNKFINILAEELSQQDGINLEESRIIIEKAFKLYMDNWSQSIIRSRIGKVARYVPGMNYLITHFKQELHGDFSLSALLNPSSPYHKDFMPVYNVITKQPKN